MSRLRVAVLCPGRGTYGRAELGSLRGREGDPAIQAFEALRAAAGQPGILAMDAEAAFRPGLHLSGEHGSGLTAAVTLSDLAGLDPDKVEVVAVAGNSMGWYTALGFAGALSLPDTARLIETMGALQAREQLGVVGGQVVYPMIDEAWRIDPARRALVEAAIAEIPDLHWSIHLGGQAVLGGTVAALAALERALPPIEVGAHRFPLRLPMHSAFHTPLMSTSAARAQASLADLPFSAPSLPLVDGRGKVWRPHATAAADLADYTLGHQVVAPFDFSAMMGTLLGDYAPDAIVLPGPGSNLGGAIAQALIALGWSGIHSKEAFLARQQSAPILLSLRWPGQAALAVRAP